jgi:AcrR family transcriptional regulator
MALIEAYAAGPKVRAVVDQARAGFEEMARQALARSPERADIPAEMVGAYIGAVGEITRTRLLAGRVAELPAIMDEMWGLIGSYRPPARPLRLAERPPPSRPETMEGTRDQTERALRALAIVVAEQGYARATVDEVLRAASMSATTFYALFDNKRDAMIAAIDDAATQMLAALLPAVRRAPDWPQSVRAGFGALFNFLAARPALARLMTIEVYAAGPEALARRDEHLEPLEALLAQGRELAPQAPAIAAEAVAGVVYTLANRRLSERGPQALSGLAPVCTYIALAPFIDAEQACEVANGVGRTR